jgi:hypothetical protein
MLSIQHCRKERLLASWLGVVAFFCYAALRYGNFLQNGSLCLKVERVRLGLKTHEYVIDDIGIVVVSKLFAVRIIMGIYEYKERSGNPSA